MAPRKYTSPSAAFNAIASDAVKTAPRVQEDSTACRSIHLAPATPAKLNPIAAKLRSNRRFAQPPLAQLPQRLIQASAAPCLCLQRARTPAASASGVPNAEDVAPCVAGPLGEGGRRERAAVERHVRLVRQTYLVRAAAKPAQPHWHAAVSPREVARMHAGSFNRTPGWL
eukprot:scaffold13.g290.t1